jgi:hypothetical protein
MATQQDVKAAFKIESASIDVTSQQLSINYVKGSTPAELPLTLRNTSNGFLIKAYPSSSTDIVKVFRDTNEINQSAPLLIPSASSVDVTVRLIGELDSRPPQFKLENLRFNLVAAQYVTVPLPTPTPEEGTEETVQLIVKWTSTQNFTGVRRVRVTTIDNLQNIPNTQQIAFIGEPSKIYADDSITYLEELIVNVPKLKFVAVQIFPEPSEAVYGWKDLAINKSANSYLYRGNYKIITPELATGTTLQVELTRV